MKKAMRKFFADGGGAPHFTLSYYSPEVDVRWTIDVEADDSLQVIYQRKDLPQTYDPETKGAKDNPDEDFWLYLSPHDAAVIGAALCAWAAAHGEKA